MSGATTRYLQQGRMSNGEPAAVVHRSGNIKKSLFLAAEMAARSIGSAPYGTDALSFLSMKRPLGRVLWKMSHTWGRFPPQPTHLSLSSLATRDHVRPLYPPPCTHMTMGPSRPATYTLKVPALQIPNATANTNSIGRWPGRCQSRCIQAPFCLTVKVNLISILIKITEVHRGATDGV